MGTVAFFNGIKIEFYVDEHPPPHFHARYAEFVAQMNIESLTIIKGSLPNPQFHLVREWASTRRKELMAAWDACDSGLNPGKIA